MEKMRQLLVEGADIEERGGEGKTSALHVAAANDHTDVALLLIEHGADVSAKNDDGKTPLHIAAMLGSNRVFLSSSASLGFADFFQVDMLGL